MTSAIFWQKMAKNGQIRGEFQNFVTNYPKMISGQAKKMFVCENPGGQKKVHQAGREFIFFPTFQNIHTKFSKEQKKSADC